MATYRQVYLIMRARDDASRVMRGMGRTMGYLNKQQEQLRKASVAAEADYKNAIQGSNQAQKAAVAQVKQLTKDTVEGNRRQRDSAINNIKDTRTARVAEHNEAIRHHQAQISRMKDVNARRQHSIATNKELANSTVKRYQREIRSNNALMGMHRRQIDVSKEQIAAARTHADAAIEQTKRRFDYEKNNLADIQKRRINAINSTADAERNAARAINQRIRQDIQFRRDQVARIQNVQSNLAGLGQAGIIVGGVMGMVGAQSVRAFSEMADSAAEFSNENRVAISVAKDFEGSVSDLGDAVLKVAREVPVPIEDLQETFYYTFSALNVGLEEATELVRGFANEAVVGNAEIQDAARSTIAIINAYDMDVSSAAATTETLTRVQNMQFNTVKWGALQYDDLSKNIGKVIPAARRAGQDIEQIGGALAFLTKQGLSAEMAASSAARAMELISEHRVVARLENLGVSVRDNVTGEMLQLNEIVVNLGRHLEGLDPTGAENMIQALAPLDGDESQKYTRLLQETDRVTKALSGPERAQALQQIFVGAGNRIQARRFWDLALANYEKFDELVKSIINDTASFSEALDLAFKEPLVALEIFDNKVEALGITIGQELLPVKLALIQTIGGLIDKWVELDSGTKQAIIRFAGFAAAVGAIGGSLTVLASIFALATSALLPMVTAMMGLATATGTAVAVAAGMAVAIPLAIGAVVAALVYLAVKWDDITEIIGNFIQYLRELDAGSKVAIGIMLSLAAAVLAVNASTVAAAIGIPKLVAGINTLSAALTALVRTHPVLAAIVVVVGVLTYAFRKLTESKRELASATKAYSDNLEANKEALAANTDAVDKLNREQATSRMQQEGLIDKAKEFGISSTLLTDAIMGEEDALKKVNTALEVNGSTWQRMLGAAIGPANTAYEKQAKNSRELQEAISRESQAIKDGIQDYYDRAHAIGGVESAVASLIEIQRAGGPQDSAERLMVQRLKDMIASSDAAKAAIAGLPPEMQEAAAAAGIMEEGMAGAEGEIKELSASAKQMQSVLEGINDVAGAFGEATSDMIESLKATHEQALESGDLTDEAFSKITESALENASATANAWITKLEEQEAEHNKFMDNIQTIIARGGGNVVDIITGMGDDAVAAAHTMANAGGAEFDRLETLLTGSAKRTSDETVAQMESLQKGLTNAIENGIRDGVVEFQRGMKLMELVGRDGSRLTASTVAKELGIGVRDAHRIANQYGQALADGINPVLEGMGRDRITVAQRQWLAGDRITGLATGGKIPGYGGGDIFPALLEPGELVVRKEIARKLDPQTLHELDIPGFRSGGFASVDDIPPVPNFSMHGPVVGGTGRESSDYLREAVVAWAKENLAPQLGAGIGYQAMMAALRTRFPGLPLISGLRPGAITATGQPSWHGKGRAVDIPPMMNVFDWIRENYGSQALELIFSPAGGRQLYRGNPHMFSGITRDMHWDHIHWAMQNGGIVNRPTQALIGEAGPEAVIPLDRLTDLMRKSLQEVLPTPGVEGRGATAGDQYQDMLNAIKAIQSHADAQKALSRAHEEVKGLAEQWDKLKSEQRLAAMQMAQAGKQGKVMSLESEQAWIRAKQNVQTIRKELAAMRSPARMTASDELGILQQKARVREARENLNALRNPQADQQAVDRARESVERTRDSVRKASQAVQEAQAAYKVAQATEAQRRADIMGAEFEVARVNQILPAINNEVTALLMRYEAEAGLADSQKALAEAEEEAIQKHNTLRDSQVELKNAQQDLKTAQQELTEARQVAIPTADELRMAELELIIAKERLTELNEQTTFSTDELRLKEIELALAERDLLEAEQTRFDFIPEYYEAQNKLKEITEKITENEKAQKEATVAVEQAEWAAMEATIGLITATQGLIGLQPSTLGYFNSVGSAAGVATSKIREQIAAIRELNRINSQTASTTNAIKAAFGSAGVPLNLHLSGARESAGVRLERLVTDVMSGKTTMAAIEASIRRIKAAHGLASGGVARATPGGVLARIAEGGQDEAVIPLPRGWQSRSDSPVGGKVEIKVEEGAFQFNGPIDSATLPQVQEMLDDFIEELADELRSK